MSARTRIKFCGMTRAEDVRAAVALGVDAIGLVFAEASPRCLTLAQGLALRAEVPPLVAAVALLMDAWPAQRDAIVRTLRPDLLQFHGSESAAECAAAGLPWLKALAMAADDDPLALMASFAGAAGFVLDGHARGEAGGSGRRFDWSRVPSSPPRPILLAGGLTAENVYDAVRQARPYAVDVSSGIESAPGVKCPRKMAAFVAAVRRADADAATSHP